MGDDRLRGDELAAFERLETLAADGSGNTPRRAARSMAWMSPGGSRMLVVSTAGVFYKPCLCAIRTARPIT